MREIDASEITLIVADLCKDANFNLGEDLVLAIENSILKETSPNGKDILNQLLLNAKIASEEKLPICQDTGFAVIFVEIGQDVHIVNGQLDTAINEGVKKGYTEGYLRKSIVGNPLERINTGDNTPAIIHTKLVVGDKLKITVAPKGGGSENMSGIKMLKPADGIEGVKDFVLDMVKKAGSNPCPPMVIGVGIGGTFEKAALLSKEALLKPVGERHSQQKIAELEAELLTKINKLGIGPQGLGGRTTALDIHIEIFPAHIASLPVAVNINCHAARHKTIIL